MCDFLFSRVVRRQPTIEYPGNMRFILNPLVSGTLTEAKANYGTPYGTIESQWRKNDSGVSYTFSVPPNNSAQVVLEAGESSLEKVRRTYPDAL